MIQYKSAYDLQQERRWTRDYVIELAEVGPVYWKAKDDELFENGVVLGYYTDGFTEFKCRVMKMWNAATVYISEKKILIDVVTTRDKRSIFGSIFQLKSDYDLLPDELDWFKTVGEFRTIFRLPEEAKTDDDIWKFLQYSSKPLIESIFKLIFKKLLFFDRDNLPSSGAHDEKARRTDTAEKTANNDEPFSGLPGLTCKRNVAKKIKGEGPEQQIQRTIDENKEIKKIIDDLISNGTPRETITKELKKNGGGNGVIGCLVAKKRPSTAGAAHAAGKRLVKKSKSADQAVPLQNSADTA